MTLQQEPTMGLLEERDESPTMLRYMGPMGTGFGMELEGGPIPAIAEYLANMLGMQGDAPSNYVSMEVNRADVGAMVLTLQRCSGKTPHQLRKDAEERTVLLEGLLAECAEELAAEVTARYAGIGDHPAMAPKLDRDMDTVFRARHALALSKGSDT